ncbi:YycH family regulatory protein [Gracilibacillus sp. D59]|uniref:YycH family regulatory protein n=1 Tax=Gracilibacillus sp. D59 TaxID=3457434 RepID=UPI003FCECD3A
MRIDFEIIKTILLVFLVSLSLLLTLGIWNYQGEYEPSNTDLARDAQLNGSDETKKNLIKPSQIVIHDGESLLGFSDKQVELEVFQDMSEWSLYNFNMISENEDMNVNEADHIMEIIFPTSIPSTLIKEIFTTDDMMIDSKFKRIYLIADENRQNQQIIFDNISQDGIDIRANVQNMAQVVKYFEQMQLDHDFINYEKVDLENERQIYIPKETNIVGWKFRYETINPDTNTFQSIFFRDPTTIASSMNAEGAHVYGDDQREVLVRGYAMEFTDFSTSENQQEQDSIPEETGNLGDFLISSSIEYINSHDGWFVNQGIQYRLDNLSEISNLVEYRMMYQNYPIFSNNGLASMSVEYQNLDEYQYNRPLMQLTFSYERAPTKLMTSQELINHLQNSDQISFSEILDIQIGYRIEQGGQVFDLIPTWCIKTFSGWEYVTGNESSTQGGETNAMGSN